MTPANFHRHPATGILLIACCLAGSFARAQVNYTPYSIVTYAGYANHGSFDRVGAAAQFDAPTGLATDAAGNVFVADTNKHTIRKITPAGVVTTVAGTPGVSGSADGPVASAQFTSPLALATDAGGNVYVADTGNHTIRKISAIGVVTTLAGAPGRLGNIDGVGGAARFAGPSGIAVDASGTVFVADTNNNSVRKISPAGVVTTVVLGSGSTGSEIPIMGTPTGVAVDATGDLYVMESSFQKNVLFKLSSTGTLTTLAAVKTSARFPAFVCAIALDAAGNVYVADSFNGAALVITPDGAVTNLAPLPLPQGIAVDANGNIFVAESGLGIIAKITPGGSPATFAGSTTLGGVHDTDGVGRAATLVLPWGVAVDAQGNLYVGDEGGSTVRKILPGGIVTTLAGWAGHMGGSQDGVGSEARFLAPYGVAVDTSGNVYVGDYGNQTIRKISPDAVVTTIAGTAGSPGSADGTGSEARFDGPTGVAVDSLGNVFVADGSNHTIRKITPAGIVTTIAGMAGITGNADGIGTNAQFWYPSGVAVDGSGNVFVTDSTNNTIRRISPDQVVTTVAGVPRALGTSIDGLAISGSQPARLLIRAAGPALSAFGLSGALPRPVLLVCDQDGNAIATNAGWGGAPVIGDSTVKTSVQLATAAIMQSAGAFPFATGSADSALVVTLPAGTYSAQVSGSSNTTGIAFVEVYEVQ